MTRIAPPNAACHLAVNSIVWEGYPALLLLIGCDPSVPPTNLADAEGKTIRARYSTRGGQTPFLNRDGNIGIPNRSISSARSRCTRLPNRSASSRFSFARR